MFIESKKTSYRYLKTLGCLLFICSQTDAATLTFKADEWCPYNCNPNDSQKPGFIVELLQAIFAIHGHRIAYTTDNFENSLIQARSGQITGVIGVVRREAPDFIFPEVEQGISRVCVFVNSDKVFEYHSPKDLELLAKVGAVKGYYYGESILQIQKKHPKNFKLVDGKLPTTELIELLKSKNIDAILENYFVMKNRIHDKPEPIRLAGCEKEKQVFVAFGPTDQNRIYAKILSDGIAQFRGNKKIQFILSKYGLSDWK